MSQAQDVLSKGSQLFRQLRGLGGDAPAPSYLFHIPGSGRTWVGASPSRTIRYGAHGFEIISAAGRQTLPAPERPFQALRELIDPALPCFFLISLDMRRRSQDPDLPLLVCLQPAAEVCYAADSRPSVFAADGATQARLEALLQAGDGSGGNDRAARPGGGPSAPWHTESDADFLARIEAAVATLQSVTGKMIITRPYDKPVPAQADPFRLFEIYSGTEPGAAAAHFVDLGGSTYSLGCSPENVFELDQGRLSFDVVASTRGISPDPEEDARWLHELLTDGKERKEHLMALERYKKRLAGLCLAGTIQEEQHMGVRTLRRVRHLHSRLSGALRPELDFLDLVEDSYPPLNSYPDELVPLADPDTRPLRYYGGIVGRAAPGGGEVSCFLNLRSALVAGGTLHTQGGVGVIADSKPRQEVLEVANKLRSLLEAVAEWEGEYAR